MTNQVNIKDSVPSTEKSISDTVSEMLKEVHTCLPGIINSFNAEKQTVEAQPTIQRVFTKSGPANLPLCVDVPVVVSGGGDFFITFPIKKGDTCLLLFSERCIDSWALEDKIAPPEDFRTHDLSDAFALVGVNPVNKAIPNFNTDEAELRNREGTIKLTLGASGFVLIGNLHVTGTIMANGKVIDNTHTHPGVQPGSGSTGTVS